MPCSKEEWAQLLAEFLRKDKEQLQSSFYEKVMLLRMQLYKDVYTQSMAVSGSMPELDSAHAVTAFDLQFKFHPKEK